MTKTIWLVPGDLLAWHPMDMPGFLLNYSPHPSFVILLFALLLGGVMLVLRFVFVGVAFRRLGISRGVALLLLWISLLGSNINIPLAQMPAQDIERDTAVSAFGMIYIIPGIVEVGRTTIAVNWAVPSSRCWSRSI